MRAVQTLKLFLLLTALLLFLAACGFYLRTTTLGSYLTTVNIDATQSPPLEQELKRVFTINGVSVIDSNIADLSVQLNELNYQKSPSLVVPREGMIEYDLTVQVTLTLWFSGDKNAVEDFSFTRAGRVRVHPNQLLSTSAEEQTVRTELLQGVVDHFVQDLYLRLAHEQEHSQSDLQ